MGESMYSLCAVGCKHKWVALVTNPAHAGTELHGSREFFPRLIPVSYSVVVCGSLCLGPHRHVIIVLFDVSFSQSKWYVLINQWNHTMSSITNQSKYMFFQSCSWPQNLQPPDRDCIQQPSPLPHTAAQQCRTDMTLLLTMTCCIP